MKVKRIRVENFRGVKHGEVLFDGNSLLVGGNGIGKSTVCEALELVLGAERLFRRPVIDEYDFYGAEYRDIDNEARPTVRIEVVLTDLSDTAERRFRGHLRRWDADTKDFVEPPADGSALELGEWCLPVVFLGRFNPSEDDFDAGTFFLSPAQPVGELGLDANNFGVGLRPFTREDKRLCGFLYLRAIRTGSRALSFSRGSLIDTIVRLESADTPSLLNTVIEDLASVTLAEGNEGLLHLRTQLKSRIAQFMPLASTESPVDVKASDLTREHVRDVLRMFLAVQPGNHAVPFSRLSTGSVNVLVFALLSYIAEIAGVNNVIFVMEEPEIALPPHTQRRMVDFVTHEMGQAIITTHSPYIIERFEPEQIVALHRDDNGVLSSRPLELPGGFKLKRYRENRRQFAEAVLARGVLVVEGATEAVVMTMTADMLQEHTPYEHLDSAGVSIFDAGGDAAVPIYAPLFSSMRKKTFAFHDLPKSPFTADQELQVLMYNVYRKTAYLDIEALLTTECPIDVIDRFLAAVAARSDNPQPSFATTGLDEAGRRSLARSLMLKRKGSSDGYAAVLLGECEDATDLPATVVGFLADINTFLAPSPSATAGDEDAEAEAGPGVDADPQDNPGDATSIDASEATDS